MIGGDFGKLSPTKYVCRWCGKNYFAFGESRNRGCDFCAGILSRKAGTDPQVDAVFTRLMTEAFEGEPPWTTDPMVPVGGPPPLGSLPPQSLPPGYPKTYGMEDSPNLVRDQDGNITSYWNGQRWIHLSPGGMEWS